MKWLAGLLLFITLPVCAKNVVNVFCWTNYIPNEVIQQFEKETGITVNFTQFSSNEEMYTKLKINPDIGYDVVVPSSYYVARMAKEHMLAALDKNNLSNLQYIEPRFLNAPYDPHNQVSVPFFWGATIIGVNKKFIDPHSIQSWSDLWQPRFRDQLLLLADMRDSFSIPLLINKASINTRDPKTIQQAYLTLKQLWPNVKLINSDAIATFFIDEDIIVGSAWNGDIYQAQQENPNIVAIYPKEGFPIWVDNLVVIKNAPHLRNAYRLINFLLNPKINAEIADFTGYSTPNSAAYKLLPKSERESSLYPSDEVLKRAQLEDYLGDAEDTYKYYWERFRAGA